MKKYVQILSNAITSDYLLQVKDVASFVKLVENKLEKSEPVSILPNDTFKTTT